MNACRRDFEGPRSLRTIAPATLAAAFIVVAFAPAKLQAVQPPPAESYAPKAAASQAATLAEEISPARTVDAYKQDVATRIVQKNWDAVADTLPPILKSVVVLDITVDRGGAPVSVAVRRSNGYHELEDAAIESVRRAGPFPAPSAEVLNGARAVSYIETWLFRPDGRFQVRSVADAQRGGAGTLAN